MPTAEKEQFVQEITQKFQDAKAIYFTDYLGLDVEEINNLRSEFFKASVDYKVVKNRLTKLASKDAGYEEGLEELLTGPTAIAFANEDPVAPAKILTGFAKDHENLQIKGAYFEGERISSERLEAIAKLPSREELLQKLLGGLQSPMRTLVGMLSSPMRDLAYALVQLKQQKNQ